MSSPNCRLRSLRVASLGSCLVGAVFAFSQKAPIKKIEEHKRDLSKGANLYVIPYSHLDTQWRWAYPQVIREYIANTLHDNFALIDKYPNYVFNFSGSRRYEMMKEYYPEDYERVKAYVAAGRWFPCGSSVDEGDANVPSGESLIRHILYGNHFFRREFGQASAEFMLPDCFGFPYALPSILAHCGLKGFSTQKLTWGSAVGIPFKVGNWVGPDGRSIVAALDPGSYSADITEDLSQNTSWLARIVDTGKRSGAYVDYHYYGTGDRGGAPRSRAVEWVETSINGTGPVKVYSTAAEEMFKSLSPGQIGKLPRYQGELLLTQHSAGSVTSEAYMKRWNRKNELLADVAERASIAAAWLGATPYPAKRLYDAWDLVLGSQMHDMLPGTSIPKAYEFCWNDELLAMNQFAAVTTDAVGAVATAMDTDVKGVAIVVYNPLSIAREDVVEATIQTGGRTDVTVYDPAGKPVPTQVLEKSGSEVKIAFAAAAPSVGFATFDARTGPVPATRSTLKIDGRILEGARFRVAIDRSGDIASIFDKQLNRETLKSPIRLGLFTHNPAQYPAWNMDWADAKKPARAFVAGPAKIRVVENGPVRVAIEVDRETEGSRFVQTVRLSALGAGDRVEVANRIDWQAKEAALKAVFPLKASNPKATYDLQLGAIMRANDDAKKYEVPQHQWFDLTDQRDSFGVAVINDGKYGSNKPSDDTVQLTLAYTPGTRAGFPDQGTQDWGRHDTLFAIAPHAGDWRSSAVPWIARRVNQPLRAFVSSRHAGSLGRIFSLFSTDNRRVEIQAIKKAEDSNEIIVRFRELEGTAPQNVNLRSTPGILSAREVDGQERPIGTAIVQNGALRTTIPAFSLRTFALKLAPSTAVAPPVRTQPINLAFDADVVSTDKDRKDGAMDATGRTYPAEQFPKTLEVDGIRFALGSTAPHAKNAIVANGQSLTIPSGYDRAYLLVASSDGDVKASFNVAGATKWTTIQHWGGFVGQWDNRLWKGDVGVNFTNYRDCVGLVPGFVKSGEVAWFCSHRHNPTAGNEFYEYSYLFKVGFDVPRGGGVIKLPIDARVKVFALSVASGTHDRVSPGTDILDRLRDHAIGAETTRPFISVTANQPKDAVYVAIRHPIYWREGGYRYTLDGSTPNAQSPVVDGPIVLNQPTRVTVASVSESGVVGAVATRMVEANDVTPPAVTEATCVKSLGLIRLRFSEPVTRQTAEDVRKYQLTNGMPVSAAHLGPDQRTVELTLDQPISGDKFESINVQNICDLSPSGNPSPVQTIELDEHGPVVAIADFEHGVGKTVSEPKIPTKAKAPWTLNFFVKVDKAPASRTMIAGFGRSVDGRAGTGRYFAVFNQGLFLWISNKDVGTRVGLNIGEWQMLTATFDGRTVRLYKNGQQIAEQVSELSDDQAQLRVMPLDAWDRRRRLDGDVRDLTLWDQDLSAEAVRRLWVKRRP